MQTLDDELRDLATQLASSVDTSSTHEEVRQRALRRRDARPRKTWVLIASVLIGIAAFVPVFLAFRGSHQAPAVSTAPSPASFKLEGRLTVWAAPAGQDQSHLYTITNGGAPQRLRVDVGGSLPTLESSWSPDGRRFVIWKSDVGTSLEPPPGRLVIVSASTGHETTLLKSKFAFNNLAWSPSGDEIAFTTAYGDIYSVHLDGSGLTQLTRSGGPCEDAAISWSPDGSQIAFARNCDNPGERGIYVMNANGSDSHLIQRPPGLPDRRAVLEIAWSPDARTLVYTQNGSVYLIGVDGTDPRLLADLSSSPTWSPDGRAIAVVNMGRRLVGTREVTWGVVTILDLDGNVITILHSLSDLTVYGVFSWTPVPS
jgi:Tol biopolymer transport system component